MYYLADRDNAVRLQAIYQAGLDIHRSYGSTHVASKREIPTNGIMEINEFLEKFPKQLSERDLPLAASQKHPSASGPQNQLMTFRINQKVESHFGGQNHGQTYRSHITGFKFVDTKKV